MDLKGKVLDDWLKRQKPSDFPKSAAPYIERYRLIEAFLAKEVHQYLSTLAALTDGVFLNDHGVDHIATVIQRASRLAAADGCDLRPYEVYLLLVAIHVHD